MKKQELKRRISAWILLAALLPMLLLSALHTHESAGAADDACVECVNHQPHAGHLTTTSQTLTDCVLCQFFSLQYLEAFQVTLAVTVGLAVLSFPLTAAHCSSRPVAFYSTRAPPYCF